MHYDRAIESARDAAHLAERADRVDIRARALGLAGHALAMAGRYEEGRTTAQEGFALAVRHELSAISAETYRRLGGVMEYSSDFIGASEVYTEALHQCRRIGAEAVACDTMGCMSYVLFRTGQWSRSLAISRELAASEAAPPISVVSAHFNLAMLRAAKGETRSARRSIESTERLARQRGYALFPLLLRWPKAYLSETAGNDDAALSEYQALLRAAEETDDRHDLLPGLCHAAACFARNGAAVEIGKVTRLAADMARRTGNPEATVVQLYCHASAEFAAGEYERSGRTYREVAGRFEELGLPLEQGHALFHAALALLRNGEIQQAEAVFDQAAHAARRLGARPLLARIDAHRPSPPATRSEGAAFLSPRQREVAALLAAGLSNKEIAASLSLSTRTAEMHVAHILDRLHCRNRAEAAARLVELGVQ
jgi:DNA-binding CsgD family transcriptional regulator